MEVWAEADAEMQVKRVVSLTFDERRGTLGAEDVKGYQVVGGLYYYLDHRIVLAPR